MVRRAVAEGGFDYLSVITLCFRGADEVFTGSLESPAIRELQCTALTATNATSCPRVVKSSSIGTFYKVPLFRRFGRRRACSICVYG